MRSAAEVMNLVAAVMVRSWSSTDQGFGYSSPSLVSALSHHSRKQAPGGTILGRLAVPLSGEVFATWSIFASEFVGISLHPCSSMRSNDPRTLRGHEKIRANLAEHLGQPIDAWMARTSPPRSWTMDDGRWTIGEWTITLHLFLARDSSVMLRVEKTSIADRAERDAAASAGFTRNVRIAFLGWRIAGSPPPF